MRKMSERQKRILRFLERYIRENSYPPTIREIQSALELSSTSVVDYNLNLLEKRGLIRRQRRASRSIVLTDRGDGLLGQERSVPFLGLIAAGQPIPVPGDLSDAGESAEMVELPPDFWSGQDEGLYALQVKGDSMIDAFIADGDLVVLRHQSTAKNGDMVAVWLQERQEVTLKRFYQEGQQVRLQPENPSMEPIYVPAREVQVQGQVVGVIRRYN
ncbi:MAG: transcriptional repressor LexA [Chloroflexia bacterium]|nr:transcriptional repressor LexA [Chloroflexia bacterium]